ncbi:unnamed protein product, partial [Durusdinium trenchii]
PSVLGQVLPSRSRPVFTDSATMEEADPPHPPTLCALLRSHHLKAVSWARPVPCGKSALLTRPASGINVTLLIFQVVSLLLTETIVLPFKGLHKVPRRSQTSHLDW